MKVLLLFLSTLCFFSIAQGQDSMNIGAKKKELMQQVRELALAQNRIENDISALESRMATIRRDGLSDEAFQAARAAKNRLVGEQEINRIRYAELVESGKHLFKPDTLGKHYRKIRKRNLPKSIVGAAETMIPLMAIGVIGGSLATSNENVDNTPIEVTVDQ